MRGKFDEQLKKLSVELIHMGALCEDAIEYAIRILEGETNLVEEIEKTESEIDQKDHEIETMCIRLILQQQPVASDLRMVSAALKMISDMERIGDQAYDIAEISKYVLSHEVKQKIEIKELAEAARKMVTASIDSFAKYDLDIARQVIAGDDKVDELFHKIKKELIELVVQDVNAGEYSLDMLMVAKYFERIGDHATNIAEWVEYSITGEHRSGQ